MVCMEHFQHFIKKDFSKIGVSYASCGPTSCQGGINVSEMEDVVSIYKVNFGPQLPHTLPLLLFKQQQWIYNKRGK